MRLKAKTKHHVFHNVLKKKSVRVDSSNISKGTPTDDVKYKTPSYCVGLSFLNLAEPQWLAVHCSKNFAGNVMCFAPQNNLAPTTPSDQMCQSHEIIRDNICSSFRRLFKIERKPTICKKSIHHRSLADETPLQLIVHAVHTPPPIVLPQFRCVVLFMRYGNTLKPSHWVQSTSLMPFEMSSHSTQTFSAGISVFHCGDQSYVCLKSLCDGYNDCKRTNTDEDVSLCNPTLAQMSNNARSRCPILYFETHTGNCLPYVLETGTSSSADFPTFNNSCACNDCVSCNSEKVECYKMSEICTYKLNNLAQLYPCSKGEHLKNCTAFQCNAMQKCSQFYCILYSYECDGKWDCPSGTDEGHKCKETRRCKHSFRCKNSQRCVHLAEVCDGLKNCHEGDDEFLCHMTGAQCPLKCQCLAQSVFCAGDFFNPFQQGWDVYFAVFLHNMTCALNTTLRGFFPHAGILNITFSGVKDVTLLIQSNLLHLTCNWNQIKEIKANSFASIGLVVIKMDNNQITTIANKAFHNTTHLVATDLSHNFLKQFPDSAMTASPNLKLLSLYNISHSHRPKDTETHTSEDR